MSASLPPSIRVACLSLAVFLMSGCDRVVVDDGPDLPDPVFQAVYGDEKLPADFFTDPDVQEAGTFYQGFNVYDGPEPGPQVPVVHLQPCAETPERAMALLDSTNVGRPLRPGQSTDEYFEFVVESGEPAREPRVYRCDAIREVTFGVFPIGPEPSYFGGVVRLGPFTARPVAASAVRGLLDRVWFYQHHNHSGAFVLERTVEGLDGAVHYRLREGRTVYALGLGVSREGRTAGGDEGPCDEIIVFETAYRIDTATGEATIQRELEAAYTGRCPR